MTSNAEMVEPCKPEDFEKELNKLAKEKGYSDYQELRDDYATSIGRSSWSTFRMRKKSQRMRVAEFNLYRDYSEDPSIYKAKYKEFGNICRDRLRLIDKNLEWLSKQTKCTEIFLNALFDGEVPCQKEFMRKVADALKFEKEEIEKRGFYIYENEDK